MFSLSYPQYKPFTQWSAILVVSLLCPSHTITEHLVAQTIQFVLQLWKLESCNHINLLKLRPWQEWLLPEALKGGVVCLSSWAAGSFLHAWGGVPSSICRVHRSCFRCTVCNFSHSDFLYVQRLFFFITLLLYRTIHEAKLMLPSGVVWLLLKYRHGWAC